MLEKLRQMEENYHAMQEKMMDPAVVGDNQQYAQLMRGAIELVKDFPGDSKLYDVLQLVVNEKYGANGTDEAKLAEQVGINSSYFSEKKHRAFTALSALLWGCDIESLLSLLQ